MTGKDDNEEDDLLIPEDSFRPLVIEIASSRPDSLRKAQQQDQVNHAEHLLQENAAMRKILTDWKSK